MRTLLVSAFILGFGSLFAEDAASAKDQKPVNTVCVMCGDPVDPKIAPVAGKTTDGKMVMMGCCSQKCADEVAKSPDIYVDAAVKNQRFNSKHPAK